MKTVRSNLGCTCYVKGPIAHRIPGRLGQRLLALEIWLGLRRLFVEVDGTTKSFRLFPALHYLLRYSAPALLSDGEFKRLKLDKYIASTMLKVSNSEFSSQNKTGTTILRVPESADLVFVFKGDMVAPGDEGLFASQDEFFHMLDLDSRNIVMFRDVTHRFYLSGIDDKIPTFQALLGWCKGYSEASQVRNVYCIGVCRGAVAALAVAHHLHVKRAIVFSPVLPPMRKRRSRGRWVWDWAMNPHYDTSYTAWFESNANGRKRAQFFSDLSHVDVRFSPAKLHQIFAGLDPSECRLPSAHLLPSRTPSAGVTFDKDAHMALLQRYVRTLVLDELPQSFDSSTSLAGQLDSFAMMQIVAFASSEFGITLSVSELSNKDFETLDTIGHALENAQSRTRPTAHREPEAEVRDSEAVSSIVDVAHAAGGSRDPVTKKTKDKGGDKQPSSAVNASANTNKRNTEPSCSKIEIGMPLLGRNNLSETPLLKHLGNLQWLNMAQISGVPSKSVMDEEGERLYATFFYILYSFPANQLPSSFAENEFLHIRTKVCRYGMNIIDGIHELSKNDQEELATGDPPQEIPFVRMCNSFVRQWRGSEWLKKSEPCSPGFERLEKLAEPPDALAVVRRARETGHFGEPRAPKFLKLCSKPLTKDLSLEPDRDVNGAGLVYFANYPLFLDIAEFHLLKDFDELGIPENLLVQRVTARRESAYFSNANEHDSLRIRMTPWVKNPFVLTESRHVDEPLVFRLIFQMHRASDKRLMMVSDATKVIEDRQWLETSLAEKLRKSFVS